MHWSTKPPTPHVPIVERALSRDRVVAPKAQNKDSPPRAGGWVAKTLTPKEMFQSPVGDFSEVEAATAVDPKNCSSTVGRTVLQSTCTGRIGTSFVRTLLQATYVVIGTNESDRPLNHYEPNRTSKTVRIMAPPAPRTYAQHNYARLTWRIPLPKLSIRLANS